MGTFASLGSVASSTYQNNLTAQAATSTGSTAASTSTSSNTDSSDITSSDFLKLLVSEMQNQDPTQPTDPNQYIQQLVGVNSLQQLISINQEIGGVTSSTSTGASASSSTGAV
jgi:flagellar basal-body rod modification protein FlgD